MTRFTYTKLSESGDWILAERNPFDGSPSLELTPSSDYGITAEEFKNCPFLSNIFNGITPLFVLHNGSGPSGILTAHSDYDLEIFISEQILPDSKSADGRDDYVLFYKGRLMHWYYKTIKDLDDPITLPPLIEAALLDYSWQRQDRVLWEAIDFNRSENLVSILIDLSKLESRLIYFKMLGCGRFLEILKMTDEELQELGKLSWTTYYQCCQYLNKDYKSSTILALKKIRKSKLSNDDKTEFLNTLYLAFSKKEVYNEDQVSKICLNMKSLWQNLFIKQ